MKTANLVLFDSQIIITSFVTELCSAGNIASVGGWVCNVQQFWLPLEKIITHALSDGFC